MKNNKPEPAIIVIFGVTGDLVKRKLFPALNDLIKDDMLHENTTVVGITRQELNTDQVLDELIQEHPEINKSLTEKFRNKFEVHTMDVNNPEDYKKLDDLLNEIEDKFALCMNRLYYLSIPPKALAEIVKYLGQSGLNGSCKHNKAVSRVLIEKPFGYDLESATNLINETSKYFDEEQIFRIDHYLAKETVQNILNFRFSNAIFESIWDKNIYQE